MLGLGVLAVVARAHQLEDLGRATAQLAGVAVDDLELHLDAQAGSLRGQEVDVHAASAVDSAVY